MGGRYPASTEAPCQVHDEASRTAFKHDDVVIDVGAHVDNCLIEAIAQLGHASYRACLLASRMVSTLKSPCSSNSLVILMKSLKARR